MRIEDAKKAYSAHLDTLQHRRQFLTKLLEDTEQNQNSSQSFDRVEISRELSVVDAEYHATQKVMERIASAEYIAYQGAAIRQQSEAAAEGAKELGKMLTIYRRIASGAKVPSRDEQKLMEFSHELYMAAKAAAMLRQNEGEEYDSLWKDEKPDKAEDKTPEEIAGDTAIAVPSPEFAAKAVNRE